MTWLVLDPRRLLQVSSGSRMETRQPSRPARLTFASPPSARRRPPPPEGPKWKRRPRRPRQPQSPPGSLWPALQDSCPQLGPLGWEGEAESRAGGAAGFPSSSTDGCPGDLSVVGGTRQQETESLLRGRFLPSQQALFLVLSGAKSHSCSSKRRSEATPNSLNHGEERGANVLPPQITDRREKPLLGMEICRWLAAT